MTKLKRNKIRSKGFWYNLQNKTRLTCKPDKLEQLNCVYFDSESEYRLYLNLITHLPHSYIDLQIHKTLTLSDIRWKVDYALIAKNGYGREYIGDLLYYVNGIAPSKLRTRCYLEYKGILDNNFLAKIPKILTDEVFSNSLILVSDNEHGVRLENLSKLRIYYKPMVSSLYLVTVLTKLRNKYNG